MRRNTEVSIMSPSMDGQGRNGSQRKDGALQEWQKNATETISRSLERSNDQGGSARGRPGFQNSIRAVTPDGSDSAGESLEPGMMKHYDSTASKSSPRSIPGDMSNSRRQGLIFDDGFENSDISPSTSFISPPPPRQRARTRTLDESARQRVQTATMASRSRGRIGSVHSPASVGFGDSTASRSGLDLRSPTLQKSGSVQDKGRRKFTIRTSSSRPASPDSALSVDSLVIPVVTEDANKILMLMKSLCGRMRGAIEYQSSQTPYWIAGLCYIDDVKGRLMYEGDDRGPFHQPIVPDLRGCRVRPSSTPEKGDRCLELSTPSTEMRFVPLTIDDFDYWLAALLCWQQVKPSKEPVHHVPTFLTRPDPYGHQDGKPNPMRRASSAAQVKDGTIIKVGRLSLWDKGSPFSPGPTTRYGNKDAKATSRSWRRVSCTLQDNGEFKLLTENDVTVLSVIQLSQLSRCAIQQLDRTVLEQEYCIGIFPQYTAHSTALSIIRPIYVSLESRELFEVWFVLLRAFSIPEIYGPQPTIPHDSGFPATIPELHVTPSNDIFRLEKSLSLRVVEAKLKKLASWEVQPTKSSKNEPDPLVGDYFAEVILDGEVRARTMTKTDTKNPFWREDSSFADLPSSLPVISVIIKRLEPISEQASHGFRSSGSIHAGDQVIESVVGFVDVSLDKIERGKDLETWWPVINRREEVVGEVFLKVRHDELAVLQSKDYTPISDLLHRFGNGLTIELSQLISINLRRLAEILMNIFQVSGKGTEWLMSLVEDEIDGISKEAPVKRLRYSRRVASNESGDSNDREQIVRDMGKSLAGEANLLFRGNSLLTQALDFHMRRVGKDYLNETLRDILNEINQLNPECEVDPSRLPSGQDLTKNWTVLINLTKRVWNQISQSVNRCPAELRHIFKYIRAVAEDRYGDFLRTVAYTSVSGFLFLRFFCPAILNPKLFDLLRDHPQPKAQRALTLIAKSLQALANLSTFGQKEEWMEPMNRFLGANRQSVKDFLDTICSLPAQRGPVPLPASYSTPLTILSRLPQTSREGFPSLPYLIDNARNFAALVTLWLESTSQYVSLPGLEGEILEFSILCQDLQVRTEDCLRRAEESALAKEESSLQWDEIAENLEIATLNDNILDYSDNPDYQDPEMHPGPSHTPWPHEHPEFTHSTTSSSGHATAPGSAGSDAGSGGGFGAKARQSFWDINFGKDSRYQRPYDGENSQASPPSRGASRNGKQHKSFLSGLRKKNNKEKEAESPEDVGPKDIAWSGAMI